MEEVDIASRTDVGCVRTNNEDSFLADESLGLYVVADGMGGHNAGEVASQKTCEVIQREIAAATKQRDKFRETGRAADARALRKVVEQAVTTAGKEIYKQAAKNPEQAGMGTTCTMLLLPGHNKGILAHVGDSRLYMLRGKSMHQLSEDHTFVTEMLKRGAITKEQAKNHPQGNVLSRALGVQSTMAVDTMIFDLDPGDTFLLCSDGLYNYYPDNKELGQQLAATELHAGLDTLINTARDRGGRDNITGVLLRVRGETPGVDNALAAEQRIAVLKRIPIFSHLTYNELVRVVGQTHLAHCAAGTPLIQEGEQGDELYVVLSGKVEVTRQGSVIATFKPGEHIGEMAMIDNAPRSATVVATSDTNLLVMRREEFFGIIRSEPVVATKLLWSFVQVLSGRLRDTNQALEGARRDLDDGADLFEIFIEGDEE